ncbi:hypothetical protein OGAPHI_000186 [Ogataea philodendri]|uniref:FAD dependent oxidoreductase domain-containing protein n=1 Tax=Ogataea philodendri TaxID=1378263 RepID=A0A9P8PHG8_9ASCO|nr:uncharacterized protein OGAPHI_000186 [Ogataea philodendri]KAH3671484.1 hypothetical protein OGAPHI_000186 [Ogataea philodendri]
MDYTTKKHDSFPSTKTTLSYWIGEADPKYAKHRTTSQLPEEIDILIIGAGYSGAAVAYNLLSHQKTKEKVLLLDARDLCSGATGRNGGHIRSYYHHDQYEFTKKYGAKIAADISLFEHYELDKVESLVKKHNIDCDFVMRKAYQTYDDPSIAREGLRDYYYFLQNPHIPKDVKDSVRLVFDEQSREEHERTAFGVYTPTSSVWPYKLVCGLIEIALSKGLNLQTNTPVEELQRMDDNTWVAKTCRGNVHAKKVVVTTNAYTRSILPEFSAKILPVKGVVSHLKTESNKTLKTNMIHGLPEEIDYISVRQDGSLIIGGGASSYSSYHLKQTMVNNTDDSYFPKEAGEHFVGYPNRNYKSLETVKFVNDYTWTGVMGFTEDNFPFVGDMTPFGRPNMFISAGFTGHGMPRILSCSTYLSELILGKKPKTEIPEPFKISLDRMSRVDTPYFERLLGASANTKL